jgi:hypothetical protein
VLAVATILGAASLVFAGVQPQLAAAGDQLYLVFGKGDAVSVARSTDAGTTFGEPVALPVRGRLALGMRRGPRIAATPRAVLVTAITGVRGGGADGDVQLFRSTDGGATWTPALVINDVPGAAREGLHAMAANEAGLVVVAWLDLRAEGTRVYTATSRDHGATWSPDVVAYQSPSGTVCECCHPSVAVDARGRIAVMFRNSLDGNRDMYVVRSSDGRTFSPAGRLGTESWSLNACPMDGGSVSLAGNGVVATWRRDDAVFLTTDAVPERKLATGRDPVIAVAGAHQDIAWAGAAGVELLRDGAAPLPLGAGRFPAVLAFDTRTVVAWEDKGSITVRSLPR